MRRLVACATTVLAAIALAGPATAADPYEPMPPSGPTACQRAQAALAEAVWDEQTAYFAVEKLDGKVARVAKKVERSGSESAKRKLRKLRAEREVAREALKRLMRVTESARKQTQRLC